jgi:hypothetical protein
MAKWERRRAVVKVILAGMTVVSMAMGASACGTRTDPGGTSGGSGSSGSGSGGSSGSGGTGNGGSGGGAKTSEKQVSDDKGDVTPAISGSEQISCDSINSEVKLTVAGGTGHWTAAAKRSPNFADTQSAQGVTVSPSSGELASGKSASLKVRGSFDKSNKYFYVVVVSRSGSTARGVEFKCR